MYHRPCPLVRHSLYLFICSPRAHACTVQMQMTTTSASYQLNVSWRRRAWRASIAHFVREIGAACGQQPGKAKHAEDAASGQFGENANRAPAVGAIARRRQGPKRVAMMPSP